MDHESRHRYRAIPDVTTDSDIIERSSTSPRAFAELYDRHAPTVHRYAGRAVGVTAAEDVMSSTFLVAFERRGAYDLGRPDALPWLLGIATNLLHRHRRSDARARRAMAAFHDATVQMDAESDASDRIDAGRGIDVVRAELARMPEREREVLLLHAWGGLDHAGIARALGIPEGTVGSRLHRARRRLRPLIEDAQDTRSGADDG
jgi:RNA polymerase sigma factor (sigma-70 family)